MKAKTFFRVARRCTLFVTAVESCYHLHHPARGFWIITSGVFIACVFEAAAYFAPFITGEETK